MQEVTSKLNISDSFSSYSIIILYIPLCVGGSKASAGQYFLYFPATRAICILPGKVVPLIHTLIFRMLHKKLAIIKYSRACNFYLWYGVLYSNNH